MPDLLSTKLSIISSWLAYLHDYTGVAHYVAHFVGHFIYMWVKVSHIKELYIFCQNGHEKWIRHSPMSLEHHFSEIQEC